MRAFVSEGDKSENGRGELVRMLMPAEVLYD